MIYYLVTQGHSYTMREFLNEWAPQLHDKLHILPYGSLGGFRLRPGTYIFSDLERLRGVTLRAARDISRRISKDPNSVQLNNPHGGYFRRLSFLRLLFEEGINPYNAHPFLRGIVKANLPAFLRSEGEHRLASGLAKSRGALVRAALRAGARQLVLAAKHHTVPRRQLVVEFHDTRDRGRVDGPFTKYSAFFIDGRVVPRHFIAGRDWYLKRPTDLDDDIMDAEWRYLQENPHDDWIRTLFALTGVDYGRIDYSLGPAGFAVWEINTNPVVIRRRERYHPDHLGHQEWFLGKIVEAFEGLHQRQLPIPDPPPEEPGSTWALSALQMWDRIGRLPRQRASQELGD